MRLSKSVKLAVDTYQTYEKDHKKAEKELKKLLKKGRELGDPILIGTAYFYIGMCYHAVLDNEGMFVNANKAVAYLKETKEYEMLIRSYVLLGNSYDHLEDIKMQIDVYTKAESLIRKHRHSKASQITILNNIANSYHRMGDNKQAIRKIKECIRLHKEYPTHDYRAFMHILNLAEYLNDDGQLKEAAEALESAAYLLERDVFKYFICDYYLRYAIISFDMGEIEKAKGYVEQSFSYIDRESYHLQLYRDYEKVLLYLLKNGDKVRAKQVFDLIEEFSVKRSQAAELFVAYRAMAEYYAANRMNDKAVEYYAKAMEQDAKHKAEVRRIQLIVYKNEARTEIDIQKLKKKLAKTEEMAYLDPLSQLLNRAALLRVSSDFIQTAFKKKEKIGAIFIDIDFFKQCNDTYGHAKGDEIIREVAHACKKEEKDNIRFARYGGDEFFGITRGLDDERLIQITKNICERIRRADIPNKANPNGGRVTVSVGIANVPITANTDTIIEIANYADKAVYYSKNAGKNCIHFLDNRRKDADGNDESFIRVDF